MPSPPFALTGPLPGDIAAADDGELGTVMLSTCWLASGGAEQLNKSRLYAFAAS